MHQAEIIVLEINDIIPEKKYIALEQIKNIINSNETTEFLELIIIIQDDVFIFKH